MTQDEKIIDEMIILLMKAARISYQEAANQIEDLLVNISLAVDDVRAERNA